MECIEESTINAFYRDYLYFSYHLAHDCARAYVCACACVHVCICVYVYRMEHV